jgi:hypothetical protein
MNLTGSIAATLLLLASWGSVAFRPSQTEPITAGPCRTSDQATAEHLHYLRWLAHGSSTAAAGWRASTLVPYVADTSADIFVEPDFTTCAQALGAYINAAKLSDTTVTDVEVVRADSVIVLSNPGVRSGESVTRYVFDASFRFLGSYHK